MNKDEKIQSLVFAIKSENQYLQENLEAILELNFTEKYREAQLVEQSVTLIALKVVELKQLIGEK